MKERARRHTTLLALALLSGFAASAPAAEYWLAARATTTTIDVETIPMWGFAAEADGDFSTLEGAATVPGPALRLASGDTTLTIHLYNDLAVPVSLVIPGLPLPDGQRTWVAADGSSPVSGQYRSDLTSRVRSFVTEAAPGTEVTYTWTGVRPGTFLYHSGTHPAVQVQMGLYGAMFADAGAALAYPGIGFDSEVALFYSEIDPALHAAVADGSYGTAAYPSTLDYRPRYFLINGTTYTAGQPPLAAGFFGQRVLLRMLNAGLESHVPTLDGLYMSVIAEDAFPLRHPRLGYGALLAAGKTLDAIVVAPGEGTHALLDRSLQLTTGSLAPGGMLVHLRFAAPGDAPSAADDSWAVDEDGTLTVPAPGVLGNDSGTGTLTADLVSTTAAGALALAADGSFTYTPNPDYSGSDLFTYRALNGSPSNVATVRITVNPINDAPIAVADHFMATAGEMLMIHAPGVLANDRDADGDPLSAELVDPLGGLMLAADGSFTFMAAAEGMYAFTYRASDGVASSDPVSVEIMVAARVNEPPVAADDIAAVKQATRNAPTSVVINVIGNDTDPDGSIDPATVEITTPPTRGGTVIVNGDGTVTYAPKNNFKGTDVFNYRVQDTQGAWSNIATVRVNVVK